MHESRYYFHLVFLRCSVCFLYRVFNHTDLGGLEMKIENVRVYDLEESVIASGFPMLSHFDSEAFEKECENYYDGIKEKHLPRAYRLASAPDGSGHRNFLSGVLVSFNVTGTNVWWMQFERYHFAQIVSSMSKMHRLKQILDKQSEMAFHEDTNLEEIVVTLHNILEKVNYGEEPETELIYSCPMGLELTARVTTNYLQLRTIYAQRKNHKLKEWRDFCEWIASLPYAKEFITLENKEN